MNKKSYDEVNAAFQAFVKTVTATDEEVMTSVFRPKWKEALSEMGWTYQEWIEGRNEERRNRK